MSEPEANTSVIDLEGNFRTTDVELPEIQEVAEKIEQKPSLTQKEKPPKRPKSDSQARLVELKTLHKNKIQQILKKNAEERKVLQKEIKDQAKKNREDLGKALKQTEKTYRVQLEQLKHDYEVRSVKLQNELETFLGAKMDEMKEHSEKVVLTDSQDRLEKLQEWLHGEFVSELQTKTNELEQTKAASDTKVQELVHEVDRKNQEIVFLQNKIKEITYHLKRGKREEILDDLGLEDDLDLDKGKKKKKNQQKGLFSRIWNK